MEELRKESDLLGELKISKTALYGIQTYRAMLNFPFKNENAYTPVPVEV